VRERLEGLALRQDLAARSFGRFLLVGGVNTVVGFGDFPLLYLTVGGWAGYLPILVFCSVFNPLFSFMTHKYITFESRRPARSEIAWYLLFCGGAFIASWGFLALIDGWNRVWFVLAQTGFNIFLTIANFVIFRRFVFPSILESR
jgi:putative flippase GtrA